MPTPDFKGKQFIYVHHSLRLLSQTGNKRRKILYSEKPLPLDENLVVHCDNLHALKALFPKYTSIIKCI